MGFHLHDGRASLSDKNAVSTAVRDTKVTATLDTPILGAAIMDNGSDGQGEAVLRDVQNGLPVQMIFGQRLK